MNVALYARVSSDQQAEKNNSIPSQLRLLHEYALKHNMPVYKEYVDKAESALSTDRPAFLEMIAEAKKKYPPFQTILVWKLSRFARNRQDSVIYKAMLKKQGIDVISISEPTDNSPQGQLMEGMIEVLDEFYSAVLSQETLRGMSENARKGFRNGGYTTFGYKNIKIFDENGNAKTKYEVNESEAKTVKMIFDLYAKGNGLKNIVIYLNEKGYKPRSGGKWCKTSVSNLLRNESYIGWTVFNKKDKKTIGRQYKPKSEWVIIKNTHEPIVNEDIFNKVQRIIKQRMPKNQHGRTAGSTYLLSGLLKCCQCHGPYGVTGYGRKRKYAYYNCLTYSRKGKFICQGHRVRADELDNEVISRIKALIFSNKNMKKLIDDINETAKSLRSDYGTKLTELKKKSSDIQLRLMRQYEAIESGVIDLNLVAPRLKALKDQKNDIQDEIEYCENMNTQYKPIQITSSHIKQYRKEMEEIFVGNNVQEKRNFLKKFIEKIIIREEGIEIVYYASGDKILG